MSTPIDYFKTMKIIWLSFIASLTMVAGIVYLVFIPQATSSPLEASVYYVIAVALATAGMIGSHFMYQIQVRSAAQLVNPVPERLMAHYQTAFLIKLAFLEAPGIFSAIAGFLTQQILFAALTAGILILMVIAKPSEQQFRQDFLNGRDL